jgi:cyanate permease
MYSAFQEPIAAPAIDVGRTDPAARLCGGVDLERRSAMRALTERDDAVINGLNALLGIILAVSPWLVGFSTVQVPTWVAVLSGLVIAGVSAAAFLRMLEWEERVNFVAGLYAMGAPWLFGFAGERAATWTFVLIGLAVTALAVIELWRIRVGPRIG